MNRTTYLFFLVSAVAACKEQASNYWSDAPVTHNCFADVAVGSNATRTKAIRYTEPAMALATMRPFVKFTGTRSGSGATVDGHVR